MTAIIFALAALAGYFVGRMDAEKSILAVYPFLGLVATTLVLLAVLIVRHFWEARP